MTNTKLTSIEKIERKGWRTMYPDVQLFSFPMYNCTVGIQRTGEVMGKFAVAICAAGEQKFRRKVGEYEVLHRFDNGTTQPVYMGMGLFHDTEDIANSIARGLGRYDE